MGKHGSWLASAYPFACLSGLILLRKDVKCVIDQEENQDNTTHNGQDDDYGI